MSELRPASGLASAASGALSPRASTAPPQSPHRETDGASDPIRVLVVDDEAGLRRSLERVLVSRGFRVEVAEDGEQALAAVAEREPEVVLMDIMMPRMSGLDALTHIKQRAPHIEVVMMTAHADVDTAVAAVKSGAYDFLTKPFASNDAVALSVAKAAEHRRLLERARDLEERLVAHEQFGELIGTSAKMQAVYRMIEGVASATSTVLILGESGTGKELVARAIHRRSPRAEKPFVPVNCAAIPKELVESELFGHVKGAFTGAQAARAGLFDSANGGTIFLDEIADLPLTAQVKLLRTLQEGEVKRVGSDETRIVDVRVLAATNIDLKAKIAEGTFRNDLYYRLNVIPIRIPPLRERDDDVALLAQHALHKLALRMERPPKRLSPRALATIRAYPWPGNVRELEHAIEHAFVLARSEEIVESDLPIAATHAPPPPAAHSNVAAALLQADPAAAFADLPYAEAKRRAMLAFDESYVKATMERAQGNVSSAARIAGLDRSNFRRLIKKSKSPL
ncbi:MAG: sigma-54-dependent transcriptional regulator [Polyangiaceae bacterium]